MMATWTIAGGGAARYLLFAVVLLMLVSLALVARAAGGKKERTRDDVLQAVAAAEQALAEQKDRPEAREQLARLLFESGDFWRAAEVLRPLLDVAEAAPKAILLAADVEYLLGHYGASEKLYKQVLAHEKSDKPSRVKSTVGLGFVYYQTNRFDRFRELDFGRGAMFPADKVIRSFDAPPYQVTWQGDQRASEVSFVVTDPLPVLTVEYDGRPVHVLFDTGADMCILDSDLARAWGTKEEAWTVGGFGGGKLARFGYGKLESMKIGDVTIRGVPVMILPTQRFSSAFAEGKFPIGGIIGTALARQFLTTLDYERGKLVLRERSPQARQALRKELEGRIAAEVSFALASTHLMMARGSLDGRDGLTFFVDSGLAADAAFSAPPQTLRYARIPEPEKKVHPQSVGGGGGAWASGTFRIASLGLGHLRQHDLKGEYGSRPASSYWHNGFIEDGLISHGFLRKYGSWTIDFDAMTYLLANPSAD